MNQRNADDMGYPSPVAQPAMNTPAASDGAVAWRCTSPLGRAVVVDDSRELTDRFASDGWKVEPLYLHPPIDRAKLLALADEWESEGNHIAHRHAAELRALLGDQA